MYTFELERFVREDLGEDDDSTGIVPGIKASARIVCKEDGVLAGLEEACEVFRYFCTETETIREDGQPLKKGDIVLEITGSAADILRAERLALNFLGRMSGIATLTARCVARADGSAGRGHSEDHPGLPQVREEGREAWRWRHPPVRPLVCRYDQG